MLGGRPIGVLVGSRTRRSGPGFCPGPSVGSLPLAPAFPCVFSSFSIKPPCWLFASERRSVRGSIQVCQPRCNRVVGLFTNCLHSVLFRRSICAGASTARSPGAAATLTTTHVAATPTTQGGETGRGGRSQRVRFGTTASRAQRCPATVPRGRAQRPCPAVPSDRRARPRVRPTMSRRNRLHTKPLRCVRNYLPLAGTGSRTHTGARAHGHAAPQRL